MTFVELFNLLAPGEAEEEIQKINNALEKAPPDVAKGLREFFDMLFEFASESNRGMVILAGAQVDEILLRILQKVMPKSDTRKEDQLFGFERPLGTFGARIQVAYRLGLIDAKVFLGLRILKKIRNDFAHLPLSTTVSGSPHRERIDQLAKLFAPKNQSYSPVTVQGKPLDPSSMKFMLSSCMLLFFLLCILNKVEPYKPAYTLISVSDGLDTRENLNNSD